MKEDDAVRTVGVVVSVLVVTVLVGVGWLLLRKSQRAWAQKHASREARINLKSSLAAITSFVAERGRYPADFSTMGFVPERGNRMVYVYSGGPIQRRDAATLPQGTWGIIGADQRRYPTIDSDALLAKLPRVLPSGVSPGVDSRGAVVVAIGDIDQDGVPLIISIASFDRPDAGMTAGGPFVEQED